MHEPVKKLKVSFLILGLSHLSLLSRTCSYSPTNRTRRVHNWGRKAQLEQQPQTARFLFLPTYGIFDRFFIRKFQFLDSFLALKYARLFSSRLPPLTHTRCIHWKKTTRYKHSLYVPLPEEDPQPVSKQLPVNRAPRLCSNTSSSMLKTDRHPLHLMQSHVLCVFPGFFTHRREE